MCFDKYVFVYTYEYTYTYLYTYIRICICVYTYLDTYTYVYRCIYICVYIHTHAHAYIRINVYIHIPICIHLYVYINIYIHSIKISCEYTQKCYGVVTSIRLLNIIGLFCRIQSLLQGSFAKETYNFKEPTNCSLPMGATRQHLHTGTCQCMQI